MKNAVIIIIFLAILILGWYKVAFFLVPDEKAKSFVEELRMNIDSGMFYGNYHFIPPLPEKQIVVPERGISKIFELIRKVEPKITDIGNVKECRIVYNVKFNESEMAPPGKHFKGDYRLVMRLNGSNIIVPKWEVFEFRPSRTKPYEERRR